jgi:hypothetical protein
MKSVSPDAIKVSRVYFTEFDRITFSQVAWTPSDVEAIRQNLERKLKLIALIKGHIVIAASHLLESELAYEILYSHPRLFSEGIIVPALRSEFTGFTKFLDYKIAEGKEAGQYKGTARLEMANMLDSEVAISVRWEVSQAAGWFKERLLSDIRDEQSLLRSSIRNARIIIPPRLASEINIIPQMSRQDAYKLAKNTKNKDLWHILCCYVDFLYYLSGARAVRSEGVLPQENLMDFSLSDMANGRTYLSEMEVFFKIFVDLVKTTTHTHFPVDFLDALSIEDVLDLHKLALEERFVEKYNTIQEKTKAGLSIHDPERLVLLMEELELFERQLHEEYLAAINKELPRYLKARKIKQGTKFLNATACLIIPPWGVAQSAEDVVVSGLELAGLGHIASKTKQRTYGRLRACSRLLHKTSLEGKPILLMFIKRIQERYTNKMLRV